jgi:hypothetical protein
MNLSFTSNFAGAGVARDSVISRGQRPLLDKLHSVQKLPIWPLCFSSEEHV